MFMNTETFTRTRTTGSYVNGVYSPTTATATGSGSVQPVSGEELQSLPENQRNKDVIKIYTKTSFIAGDEVTIDSNKYLVIAVEDYYRHSFLAHFKIYAVRNKDEGQR